MGALLAIVYAAHALCVYRGFMSCASPVDRVGRPKIGCRNWQEHGLVRHFDAS